jgi:hypothetical protein
MKDILDCQINIVADGYYLREISSATRINVSFGSFSTGTSPAVVPAMSARPRKPTSHCIPAK